MDKLHELMKVLEVDATEKWQLQVMEVIGNLVLMLHWQRGIIDALVRNGNITLAPQQLDNWNRVIKNLELYEEFTWEVAPSRAMLLILRHFRNTGELLDNYEAVMASDTHGRIPYGLTNEELDDIEDIIRKLKDARQITGFGHAENLLRS